MSHFPGYARVPQEDAHNQSSNAGRDREDDAGGRQSAGCQSDGCNMHKNRYVVSASKII